MSENQSIQISTYNGKLMKYLLYLVIVFVLINTVIFIKQAVENDIETVHIINSINAILMAAFYLSQSKVSRLNFIHFETDRFILQKATAFKQSKDEILFSEISSINQKLNKIEIGLKNNSLYEIDIQNYPFASMTQIKQEFKKLNMELVSSN